MKKTFKLILTLVLIGSLCASIVACSPECKDKNKDHICDSSDCSANIDYYDENNDGLCDCGCGEKVANLYVSISNKGELVMAAEKIVATDRNDDGKINIDEALYAAHEKNYEGGAKAGYSTYTSDYGLSLGTLWGDASGSFGYYLNNTSAWSIGDEVSADSHVYAFIYKDTTAFSDSYSFFNIRNAEVGENGLLTLVLNGSGFDENWNSVTLPVSGATITIDGVATAYVTDAEGKVTVKLKKTGENIISATSKTATLVPPVCLVKVGQ